MLMITFCDKVPIHVFGEYSRKLPLCIGDHVIALYNGNYRESDNIVILLLQYSTINPLMLLTTLQWGPYLVRS